MRRYIGAFLGLSAVVWAALGCVGLQDPSSAGTGGGGARGSGGTAEPPTSTSASAGAGGGAGSTESTEADPLADPLTSGMACTMTSLLSAPVIVSAPHARAMVSAPQIRGMLGPSSTGPAPPPSLVRTSELLNYYHLDYPSKSPDGLTVVPELLGTDVPGEYLLQVGVQAAPATLPRRPTSLTVVVDTSKSMEGESMKRANAAIHALSQSLNQDDVLNILTTSSEIKPVHRRAMVDGDPALFAAADELGVTKIDDLALAVEHGYEVAKAPDSYFAGGLNRLVLITDGGIPASALDPVTATIADRWSLDRIQLVGVGVGSAIGYHDDLLAAATTTGHGPSLYLDSVAEADVALHQRFTEVFDEAANDLTIAIRLPWMFQADIADPSGFVATEETLTKSDLAPGRSIIFSHTLTMCPGIQLGSVGVDLPIEVTARWTVPGALDRLETAPAILQLAPPSAQPSIQTLKIAAIRAFGSALQQLDAHRLQDACTTVATTQAVIAKLTQGSPDPELTSILQQLAAHPLLEGKACGANVP